MDTRIAGIPAKIEVTSYYPGRPARLTGHPDTWYPPEYEELTFQVLDRRGRPAPWLERKLDEQDRRRIERELKTTYHDEDY